MHQVQWRRQETLRGAPEHGCAPADGSVAGGRMTDHVLPEHLAAVPQPPNGRLEKREVLHRSMNVALITGLKHAIGRDAWAYEAIDR